MSIAVRISSAAARAQIRGLEKEIALLRAETAKANTAMSTMGAGGIKGITKWGSQVQWAGRQLTYNFSIPLAIAGGFATKFALDNERAMTRVIKVYGDGTEQMSKLAKSEIPALAKAFEALSSRFGVAQADAINIAADWAAAGASGVALAKSVKLTMETMILGELEAADATQALIAIQAQYGQSVEELAKTIDTLNMIENQTGIQMEGLIQGFARAAGVARDAGIDVRHLGAMLAALVPSAGTATQAGNSLKTMISRLLAPTKEAAEVLGLMGINTADMGWKSLNATQRMEKLSKSFVGLDDAQKAVVSSTIASRWQINRFSVLMRDMASGTGYYEKSLESTASATKNFKQRVYELNTVLESNPQRLKQMWVILQNAMADVIQPMIPYIVTIAAEVARLGRAFANMDPATQKLILAFLTILALVGPVARYIGAVGVLLGLLGESASFAGGKLLWLGRMLLTAVLFPFTAVASVISGAIGLIGTGVAAAVTTGIPMMVGAIGTAATAMVTTFTAIVAGLPGAMMTALLAVGNVVLAVQPVMARISGAIGVALATTSAYVYTFFAVQMPAAISRASAMVFAASVKVSMLMASAVTASGTALVAAVGFVWESATALIARTATTMYAATVGAITPLVAGVTRFFAMLPAMVMWGMASIPTVVGAVATRAVAVFTAAFRGIPIIAAATWQAVLSGVAVLKQLGPAILAAVTSPVTYIVVALAAALGVLWNFRSQIAKIWNSIFKDAASILQPFVDLWWKAADAISRAFWMLPSSVRDSILAVVNIIRSAALAVYEWFSYLNPFAHHSPSLVEQVTAGMAEIRKQYASVGNVGSVFKKAASDLAAYKKAISAITGGPYADEMASVAEALPSALPLFKALVADLGKLNIILNAQATAVAKQQSVVDAWASKLDNANAKLDSEQKLLESVQAQLDSLTQAYNDHKDALSSYANAPLKGMGEMEDAIFANEQAQKQLRLEMLQWEDANGTIDDIQNNMAKLAGSIEAIRGEASSLRAAGAGSDILGPVEDQIRQMQDAYAAMQTTAQSSPVGEMQSELDKLARQGEILDLTKSVNFDPMLREIDKLANAQKELTYSEIVAGIERERAAMNALEPQINAATEAVKNQQAAVDAATASRDAISSRYDVENGKLRALNAEYDTTRQMISDVEDALRTMSSAADDNARKLATSADAASRMSPGAQNFLDAAGGNFPDVGGTAKIGREGGLGDQSKLIDEFTKGINDEIAKSFSGLDMFAPIKEKWNQFKGWFSENIGSKFGPLLDGLKSTWTDVVDAFNGSSLKSGAIDGWNSLSDSISTVWDWGKKIWSLFEDDIRKVFDEVVKAGRKIWDEIGPELAKFKDLVPGLTKIFGFLWDVLKIIGGFVAVQFLGALKILASVFSNILGPAIDLVVDIVKNVIKILRGLIEFIVGVFTGDWALAWQGIKDVVSGLVGGILGIFKNLGKLLWGVVKGLVEGVVEFFQWLYDVLVGHSIIPDMVNDIIDWFASLPGKAWDALVSLVKFVTDIAVDTWNGFTSASSDAWASIIKWIKTLGKDAWDNLKDIVTKLSTGATEAWNSFWTAAKDAWSKIIAWVKTLGKDTWEGLKDIVTKLRDGAKEAWDTFWLYSKTGWGLIFDWIKGLPQKAYDGIKDIISKLRSAASSAFSALFDEAKAIVDGKSGLMSWIGGIPGRIGKALGSIGSTVANAVKGSWNGAAGWLNDNAIGAVNKVTSKFGFKIDDLPKFAGGGVIPGRVSKKDNTIIAARTGEGVIVPELVRQLGGARGLAYANKAAKTGNQTALERMGIGGYANGGIIGKVEGWLTGGLGNAMSSILGATKAPIRGLIPGHPFAEDWVVGGIQGWQDAAKRWGDKKEASGAGVLPQTGYQWQIKALHSKFPNAVVTSSFRPGAITALGNKSMHGMGRAIDIAPSMDIFNWIRGTYGKNTKQLFYSPADGRTILNGKDWNMDSVTKAGHWDHVHWGYDKGGLLNPGLTMAYNGTGKTEYTLTNEDWNTFSSVLSLMDTLTQKSGVAGAPGGSGMASVGATLARVEGRLRTADTQVTRLGGGGGDTFNFYGDLEFPNISDGSDAEEFVRNLKGLAG